VELYRRTYAEINLDHIAHNFEVLKKAFPQAPLICPMVKANAYGHGDVAVALCLEQVGATHLGVCLIEEGLTLRKGGVKAEILVFRGFDREGAEVMLQNNLTPVIADWNQLEVIQAVATKAVSVHLKFNTGMNRLGFQPQDAQKLFDICWQNPKIRVQGILTHLYNGEDAFEITGRSQEQLADLEHVIEVFKPLKPIAHALASAGILNSLVVRGKEAGHPLNRVNWGLRPGLMIYGFNPLVDQSILPLKPVMTLKSLASSFQLVAAGKVVSYSGTWTAKRDSVVAVVPIGYADGYHRILSNKSTVLFAGKKAPVVGNICMDFLMIDVTDIVQNKNLADFKDKEVILIGQNESGENISASELAKLAQTITWEILTSVSARVPRVFTGAWAKKLGLAG